MCWPQFVGTTRHASFRSTRLSGRIQRVDSPGKPTLRSVSRKINHFYFVRPPRVDKSAFSHQCENAPQTAMKYTLQRRRLPTPLLDIGCQRLLHHIIQMLLIIDSNPFTFFNQILSQFVVRLTRTTCGSFAGVAGGDCTSWPPTCDLTISMAALKVLFGPGAAFSEDEVVDTPANGFSGFCFAIPISLSLCSELRGFYEAIPVSGHILIKVASVNPLPDSTFILRPAMHGLWIDPMLVARIPLDLLEEVNIFTNPSIIQGWNDPKDLQTWKRAMLLICSHVLYRCQNLRQPLDSHLFCCHRNDDAPISHCQGILGQ